MTREKGGGQGRKSEREKTTAKNKNQMHKSQWRDLMKPRFRYLFFSSTLNQGAHSITLAVSYFTSNTLWQGNAAKL